MYLKVPESSAVANSQAAAVARRESRKSNIPSEHSKAGKENNTSDRERQQPVVPQTKLTRFNTTTASKKTKLE